MQDIQIQLSTSCYEFFIKSVCATPNASVVIASMDTTPLAGGTSPPKNSLIATIRIESPSIREMLNADIFVGGFSEGTFVTWPLPFLSYIDLNPHFSYMVGVG